MATGGNARSRVNNNTPGPWMEWWNEPGMTSFKHFVRFAETYCYITKGMKLPDEPIFTPRLIKFTDEQKQFFSDILAEDVTIAVKSCPRGEGKSTEMAALAIWATFADVRSGTPDVPIIATTVSQAIKALFSVCKSMIDEEPELADRCMQYTAIQNTSFYVPSTGGNCYPKANTVEGLQGLDPSLAIADEIGFQPMESWTALTLAAAKRDTSLVVGTGTPGITRDNALWLIRKSIEEHGLPDGMVYLEIAAPEGCDHRDETIWYDTLPALRAGYKSIKALRVQCGSTPEALFRIYNLGQWAEGADSWLGSDSKNVWDSMQDPYVFDPDQPLYCALDVGLKRDSTALCMIQTRQDKLKPHVKFKIWQPQKGKPVNIDEIMQYIRELSLAYRVRVVAYDPRLFEYPGRQLADENIPMKEFPQSVERMSPPTAELYDACLNAGFTHDDDEIARTQVIYAVVRPNERGFMLSKNKSTSRIDAAVALTMAWQEYTHPEPVQAPLACF